MASYNAKIELQLAVNRALQKLQKVERAIEKAASMAGIEVKVKGVERIERAVQNTNEGAQKLAKTFQDIENKALSKLPVSLQTVIAYLKAASSVAAGFAKSTALAMAEVGQGIDKTIQATSKYTTEIVEAAEAMERLANEQARLSRQERLAGSRGSAGLNALLRSRMAQRAEITPFGSPAATAEYERLSRQIIQLRGAINVQLRQQEMIENKILGYQREQAEAVRRNVSASKEAREAAGQGFAQFSQSIDTYLSKAKRLEKEVSKAGGFRQWDENIKRAFAQYTDALNEIKNLERRNALEQTELEIKLSDTELKKDLENERVLKQQKEKNLQDLADFDTRLANRVQRKKELQELGQRRRRALGEAAIGGAFPLLFGGGPGAAVGGSVGGLLGGLAGGQFGLALSLLGSQIGTTVDGLVTKAGDLGKALNTLTGDFEVILDSLGVSGTQTEQLIKALAELEGKNAALEESTRRLALVVGDDGVKALTDFGLYSTDFNNAVVQLTTILLSEAAKIINFIGKFVPFAQQTIRKAEVEAALRTDDPRLKEAQEAVRRAGFASTRIPAEDKLLSIYQSITGEQDAQLKSRVYSQQIAGDETSVLQIQGKILELNTDLKNKERQQLERSLILEKSKVAVGKLKSKLNKDEIDFFEYSAELAKEQQKLQNANLKLDNDIAKAFEKKAKRSKKVRDYTKDIAREEARQFQLQQQIAQVGVDRVKQIDIQLKSLKQREALERAFIISSTEDTGLQNAKLETLRLIIALEEKRLTTGKQQIQIQKQIAELSRSQELGNLRRGLEQEFESGQLPTGDPFRDPFIDLEREQRFRRADVFAGLDQQRDRLRIQRSIPGVDTGEIDKQLQNIEDQRAAYESLLPSIEANQRAQLLYNQTLSQVEGPVNALVGGLQDIVAGTKTAQEVFADFLKTIADQLIQTAATMIAQYIAIGIAKAFAFGGGGGGGLNTDKLANVSQYSGITAGTRVPFAEGGYVTGPTNALIGEGGEPEYVIPRSKMRESMARYSRGARGSSVIPSQAGGGDSEMSGGTAVAAPIDVRYTVERINSVDYVTADQFQLGMQRAAQQGAAEGERRTLRSLKNSPGTRRGVGM